jgi:tRNA pseudouridine38-40 synthase
LQRYAYKIYYDGTRFYGFQRQPKVKTIEEELMKALIHTRALSHDPATAAFASAGRTDRFVSALGNVFAVNTETNLAPVTINSWLSDGIRVWSRASVPISFDPRHALRRHYKYLLQKGDQIDLDLMTKAAEMFLGVHDFRRFAHRPSEGSSVREIYELSIEPKDDFICISVVGDGFLRRMVRKIVGALTYVASGLLNLEEVRRLFDPVSSFPPMGVPTAPPRNLILWDVDYGFSFEIDTYAVRKIQLELTNNLMELIRSRTMLNALQELGKTDTC